MNPQDVTEAKIKRFIIVWTAIWATTVFVLIVYWHNLPAWISWPLCILEALATPDFSALKEALSDDRPSNDDAEA